MNQQIVAPSIGHTVIGTDDVFSLVYRHRIPVPVIAVKSKGYLRLDINGPLDQQSISPQPLPIYRNGFPDLKDVLGNPGVEL